ncbi:MAG: hypothetical protein NTW30_05560 [Candidatus Aenigmarchaeota archaeon]|nr:hypothetical protein [Candidatus Aenigmarchaeota archaeon]
MNCKETKFKHDEKKCTKCCKVKKTTEFGYCSRTKDNLTYRCSQCNREATKKWLEDPENRKRAQKATEKWVVENRDKVKKWKDEHSDYQAKYHSERRKNDPEFHKKHYARAECNNERIRRGRVKMDEFCALCIKERAVEFHHFNYDSPLDIVCLCRRCHLELHKAQRRADFVITNIELFEEAKKYIKNNLTK